MNDASTDDGGTATDDASTATEDGRTTDETDGSSTGELDWCGDPSVAHVLVDFGGAEILPGLVDNGPAYVSANTSLQGVWSAYTDGDEAEVIDLIRGHYAAYTICITDAPPTVPDYTVIVVTNDLFGGDPNVVQVTGPEDCDNTNLNDLDVNWIGQQLNLAPITKSIIIARTIANKMGLDNVEDTTDIMHIFVGNTNNGATFTDACAPYPAGGATVCESFTGLNCQDPLLAQNAHERLVELLGG